MSDEIGNLILGHMRSMRADMARMAERLDTLSADVIVIRQHMAGRFDTRTLHDREIAGLQARVERIERRLELID